ncbi:MAG: hypothetical protein N2167_09680 [Flavobacteriales bacterium]|nr:hypothetical protein [Flavobacteriales bacterium]
MKNISYIPITLFATSPNRGVIRCAGKITIAGFKVYQYLKLYEGLMILYFIKHIAQLNRATTKLAVALW